MTFSSPKINRVGDMPPKKVQREKIRVETMRVPLRPMLSAPGPTSMAPTIMPTMLSVAIMVICSVDAIKLGSVLSTGMATPMMARS